MDHPHSGLVALSESYALRGYFDHLVVSNELQRVLERDWGNRRQEYVVVLPGRPHIGEFLFLAGIDVEIGVPIVLADDHAPIHPVTGLNEQGAARFEVE